MLVQPADGLPGIFIDRFQVIAVVQEDDRNYRVGFVCGLSVCVSKEHGERLLAEMAGK